MKNKNLEYEPLINDGSYPVVLHSYEFTHTFGEPRLKLYFQLAEISEHKNCIFTKWFNIMHYSKKPNSKHQFKASKRSDFVKYWKRIFPNEKIKRFDRFALSKLKNQAGQASKKSSRTGI